MTKTSQMHEASRAVTGRLQIRPMDAVTTLFAEGEAEVSDAVISALSQAVFENEPPKPAGKAQQMLARLSYRLLKRTTVPHQDVGRSDAEITMRYRNRFLDRSKHPYAETLMGSSCEKSVSIVEGAAPMNGPYMMIVPEIFECAGVWDKLLLNSVLGREVQLRFVWETRATHAEMRRRLLAGEAVNVKALAAGTGLSLIVAYDRLVREGLELSGLRVRITDREARNVEKTRRLLAKLAGLRGWQLAGADEAGIWAETEDVFAGDGMAGARFDVVTAVGILEYFQGSTCDTTEARHGLAQEEEPADALNLVARLCEMTRAGGSLVVNTFRPHASTRILELFGKRFDYRHPKNMAALLAGTQFREPVIVGSGLIYDVKVYKKGRPQGGGDARHARRASY